MKLSDLVVDVKKAWIDFPLGDFKVEIAHLSKPEIIKLRKSCTEREFDRRTRLPYDKLNEEKFIKAFTEKTILNWKNLTVDVLESLIAIDSSKLPENSTIPYSQENALLLITQSSAFDEWVNEAVFDLENFRDGTERAAVEEAE